MKNKNKKNEMGKNIMEKRMTSAEWVWNDTAQLWIVYGRK